MPLELGDFDLSKRAERGVGFWRVKNCGRIYESNASARSVGARNPTAASVEDEFEEVIPIVWRVLRNHPAAQKEVEDAILAGVKKRREREVAKRD